VLATATVLALLLALPALAHLERTSYWPDPAPDTSISPAAGGAVPTARSLESAVPAALIDQFSASSRKATKRKRHRTKRHGRHHRTQRKAHKAQFVAAGPGSNTRVVCQSDSLARVTQEIAAAQTDGFRVRPTVPLEELTPAQAARLLALNKALFSVCAYHDIQPAVNDSHNNDRVVIMPGVYTEPSSRAVAALPPECDKYRTTSEKGPGAVSYEYQFHCPNGQSLVAVIGRALGPGADPPTSPLSRPDPHGIPNRGPCIRCNMQIEGSGPTSDDTVIDAGNVSSGNGPPMGSKKDVALKIDRGDGIVLRNMTVRHAAEHDVYILETNGYLMDRMKYFYAGEYGALMFASDYGLTQNCEAVGSGDSGVYPGGAPDTGQDRNPRFYPTARLNQEITHCDSHHNNMGYSGTMGNATHVVDNNFYDNTTGIVTDSFYAGGHPGYPQDSAVFERNRVYSNNFNVYDPNSGIKSATPVPMGVGILIAGGNYDLVRDNYIYDNWRRGTMLLSVPDAVACEPHPNEGSPPCQPGGVATTSNFNRYQGNVMGRAPDGTVAVNGVDFWWDQFATNHDNCWYPNTGSDGTASGITGDPQTPPITGTTVPGFLPEDCYSPAGSALSVGQGNPLKEAMLFDCALNGNDGICEWYMAPAKPGSARAHQQAAQVRKEELLLSSMSLGAPTCQLIGGLGGTLTCPGFRHRI
jgi:hypothetical protein